MKTTDQFYLFIGTSGSGSDVHAGPVMAPMSFSLNGVQTVLLTDPAHLYHQYSFSHYLGQTDAKDTHSLRKQSNNQNFQDVEKTGRYYNEVDSWTDRLTWFLSNHVTTDHVLLGTRLS